jgi:hypothetical protein
LVFAAACSQGGASGDGGTGGSPCDHCPSGYTCGSANGAQVCRSPAGIPLFNHVFVILMENTSLSSLQSDSPTNTPFLHGLLTTAAISNNYHGVAHPSLPNYLALTSGMSDVMCDCDPTGTACTSSCGTFSHACGCPQSSSHLGQQLETAGKTWRAYGEDMGTACNTTTSGNYAARHVPFVYYADLQANQSHCADRVVDYAAKFAGDLTMGTPDFLFIAPNLIDDMHDPVLALSQSGNLHNGDVWLAKTVAAIQNTDAYKKGGALFIVWDEDDHSGIPNADDPIPFFLLSPLAKTAFASTTRADHYALLATFEDGLGVGRLGMAAQATPLADLFPAN